MKNYKSIPKAQYSNKEMRLILLKIFIFHLLTVMLMFNHAHANVKIIRFDKQNGFTVDSTSSTNFNRITPQMEVWAIGDTFNVVPTGSPQPYPQWRFMRYFHVSTGTNPVAYAGLKLTLAADTTNPATFIEYTLNTPVMIQPTDDSLLIDMGVLDECTVYSYGVDMFYSIDTVKSAFSQIKIMECTTGITSQEINFTLYNGTIVAPLKATIEVYDLVSRKIRHGISELNVSDLYGMYIVRVYVGKNSTTRKYSF